jgi:hypothetical protein
MWQSPTKWSSLPPCPHESCFFTFTGSDPKVFRMISITSRSEGPNTHCRSAIPESEEPLRNPTADAPWGNLFIQPLTPSSHRPKAPCPRAPGWPQDQPRTSAPLSSRPPASSFRYSEAGHQPTYHTKIHTLRPIRRSPHHPGDASCEKYPPDAPPNFDHTPQPTETKKLTTPSLKQ